MPFYANVKVEKLVMMLRSAPIAAAMQQSSMNAATVIMAPILGLERSWTLEYIRKGNKIFTARRDCGSAAGKQYWWLGIKRAGPTKDTSPTTAPNSRHQPHKPLVHTWPENDGTLQTTCEKWKHMRKDDWQLNQSI